MPASVTPLKIPAQDRKRFYQGFPDGAFDFFVADARMSVAFQHDAVAHHDAFRRVGKRIVEVENLYILFAGQR